MSKHTPGPWKYVEDICGSRVEAQGMGFSAPYRLEHGSGRCAQQVADNKLIASAPDLLALLRRVWEDEYAFRTKNIYELCLKCNGDNGKHAEDCIITCLQKALGIVPKQEEPEYKCESCNDTGVRNERESCPYCDKVGRV
jgi:ribosomal protein L40E